MTAALPVMASDTFPVTHSIVRPEGIAQLVAERHALPDPVRCELLRPGLNDTYLLRTGTERHIARLYHVRRRRSEIDYELDLLMHLAAKGVPVAESIADAEGRLTQPVKTPEGTRFLVLFRYAPGVPLSWKVPGQCQLAGSLLGAIHAASDDFVSRYARVKLNVDFLVDSSLSAVRPFLVDRTDDWQYLERLAETLTQLVHAAEARGLDWGVCHGDFGAKNIHVTADSRATVLDFDYSGAGWRIYDFAPIRRASLDQQTPIAWDAFVAGYRQRRRLSENDLEAVMLFRALRHLAMLGVFARNVSEWGMPQVTGRQLDGWLAFFRDWEAEHLPMVG